MAESSGRGWQLAAIILGLLFCNAHAAAQREFNVWCFGDSTGLDFNLPGPQVLTGTGIYAGEGMACISDRTTGALLFYSDGRWVWNRNHRLMPGGRGLKGGTSSTQAALIVPMPGNFSKYYLFSSEEEGQPTTPDRGVVYSIVDMNADGGLGDVVQKNIPLIAPTNEKLVAVPHCNNSDFWIITHSPGDNRFHAFLLTASGIAATPVVSAAGEIQREPRYWLAASPNGKMLASVFPFGMAELFDFDPCAGVVSNARVLLKSHVGYGICFSPDNSKVYTVQDSGSWRLMQFDLADNYRRRQIDTIPYISSSTNYMSSLQIGPDGKIYCARVVYRWLGVIEHPNRAGAACNFRDSGIYLDGRRSFWGLPNIITGLYRPQEPYFTLSDTIICAGECITVAGFVPGNPQEQKWTFPGGTPAEYTGPGPVQVCYSVPGRYHMELLGEDGATRTIIHRFIRVEDAVPPTMFYVEPASGAPGDTVNIPVLVLDSGGREIPAQPFTFRLRFNGRLLRPLEQGNGISVEYDGGECLLTVVGSGENRNSDTLCKLRMLVGLGDADSTTIGFDTAAWIAGCGRAPDVAGGLFSVEGICREGTPRLFIDRLPAALKGCSYDKGSGTIEIHYRVAGEKEVSISLADMLGGEVAAIAEFPSIEGDQLARIDAADLATGIYFCTLRTGGRIWTLPVYITQ